MFCAGVRVFDGSELLEASIAAGEAWPEAAEWLCDVYPLRASTSAMQSLSLVIPLDQS